MKAHQTPTKEIVQKIIETCTKYGWKYSVRGEVLTIDKFFEPGNIDEFVKADGEYYSILSLLPRSRPGSDWGTDGGGIGGQVAIDSGHFRMNRSGGNKMILKELSKSQ